MNRKKETQDKQTEGCYFTSKRFFSETWLTVRLVGNAFFSDSSNRQDWETTQNVGDLRSITQKFIKIKS